MIQYRRLIRNLRVKQNEKLAVKKHASRIASRKESEKDKLSSQSDGNQRD